MNGTSARVLTINFHKELSQYIENKTNYVNCATSSDTTKLHKSYNGTVDPIKSDEDIQAAKDYFLSQPQRYQNSSISIRNYLLFVLGCNCARRIGDLLSLKISDVLNENHTFKEHISLTEQKTGKFIKVKININVKEAMTKYLNSLGEYNLNDYIFQSRDGNNQPITTRSAWRIMNDMGKAIGLLDKGLRIGTHSLRKTWGNNAIRADMTNPMQIVAVQKALNHSSPDVTLRYVGIDQENMDNLFDSVLI